MARESKNTIRVRVHERIRHRVTRHHLTFRKSLPARGSDVILAHRIGQVRMQDARVVSRGAERERDCRQNQTFPSVESAERKSSRGRRRSHEEQSAEPENGNRHHRQRQREQ